MVVGVSARLAAAGGAAQWGIPAFAGAVIRTCTDDGRRARLTVITRGARGCTAYSEGEAIDVPSYPVDVVSTLGAGDVFHGALLACLVRGLDPRDALVHAYACAALSCRALDGRSAISTWDELERSVRGRVVA